VLPVKHPMARLQELQKDDLYRLSFICLDAQSTTRKVVDQLLSRGGLDVQRLRIEMELNSLEAIKNAVQSGLGAAFLPVVSIERELASGTLHRGVMADLSVRRQLRLITHPARYCSRASAAFRREILPVFASPDSYIVACDGIMKQVVGAPKSSEDWSWNNPISAVNEFMAIHPEFECVEPTWPFNESKLTDRVTYWPNAFLKRVA